MLVTDLPLEQLKEASWNPNSMDAPMLEKLKESITRYGLVSNLVVRPIMPSPAETLTDPSYEVLSGNQRLQVLRELGYATAPCVVVTVDDSRAKLLAQALNRIGGADDLGLKAQLLREVLQALPQEEVLRLLPETSSSLEALSALGQETMAQYLQHWQQAQGARLKHLQFQFTPAQLEIIEEALALVMPQARAGGGDNPNVRSTALYLLCRAHLHKRGKSI